MFRTISQTGVSYRGSRLSVGRAGRVRGGDRLPWIEANDNFAPLSSLAWQVHVYGAPAPEIEAVCRGRGTGPCTSFPGARRCGEQDSGVMRVYLVRPDGYVALAERRRLRVDAHTVPG